MKDGYFDGIELWFRCIWCGDSTKDPSKAHCSVNVVTALYHCYKCQVSGKMTSYDMGFLTKGLKFDRSYEVKDELRSNTDSMIQTIEEKMRSGPGLSRYSALDRYHIKTQDGTKLDVFKITDASHEVYGYHIRHPVNKNDSRTYGKRLLGMSSKIRYSRTWRVVEGPYDCVDPHSDVCCFGFPSEMQAKALYGQELILCPDGDVFDDWRKLRLFMKPFLWDINHRIAYIERLPPGLDPDDVFPKDREQLSTSELKQMLTPKKTFFINRMSAEQIMENINANIGEEQFWSEYAENSPKASGTMAPS